MFPADQQQQVRSQLAAVLEGLVCQALVPAAGAAGRVAAAEIMVATPAIRNLIREGKSQQGLLGAADRPGPAGHADDEPVAGGAGRPAADRPADALARSSQPLARAGRGRSSAMTTTYRYAGRTRAGAPIAG